MDEYLLKMNGLSREILEALSYESQLGIPLKRNLHYFDKRLLIKELMAMTDWLHDYLYKKNYPAEIGKLLRDRYENGRIRNETEFKEALENVLSDCKRP